MAIFSILSWPIRTAFSRGAGGNITLRPPRAPEPRANATEAASWAPPRRRADRSSMEERRPPRSPAPDDVTLMDRGRQRRGERRHDLGRMLPTVRHRDDDVATTDQPDGRRGPEPDRRPLDRLTCLIERHVFEVVDRPGEQTFAFLRPDARVQHAIEDHDDAPSAALAACAQAEATSVGVAGLQAIGQPLVARTFRFPWSILLKL